MSRIKKTKVDWSWRRAPSEMVKCPSCNLLIHFDADKCEHCGAALPKEKMSQLVIDEKRKAKTGMFVALIGIPAFLVLLTFLENYFS